MKTGRPLVWGNPTDPTSVSDFSNETRYPGVDMTAWSWSSCFPVHLVTMTLRTNNGYVEIGPWKTIVPLQTGGELHVARSRKR